MLIFHFIGLVMGLGTGFAHVFLGKMISKLDRSEAEKFRDQTKALSLMGFVGILLLIISGVYLILPFWPSITSFPLLITKLFLVFILVVLILLINLGTVKAYKNDTEKGLKGVEYMGKLSLLIGITIVIVAVNFFR